MGSVIADVSQHLVGIWNDRRTLVRPDRGNPLAHGGNPSGVGDHDLLRLVASQVLKLAEHFLCRAEIERRLIVAVLKALSCHDNPPVNLVLRIQKMHVAGGADRFVKPLSQLYNLPVQIL